MHKLLTAAVVLTGLAVATGCSSDNIRNGINKTGDVAGQALGEFSSGVTSGVERAITPEVTLGDSLRTAGVSLGKVIVTADSGSTDNMLNVYLIFAKSIDREVTARVMDHQGAEMGRNRLRITRQQQDAGYVTFTFDRLTDIDNDSKIVLE